MGLDVVDVGVMGYRAAWDRQLELHAEVAEGARPDGVLMLVEHPPVVTIGRRPEAGKNLLAGPELLRSRGVEVVETDRGGDITFHGPGQLVAYPILALNRYNLNLHSYMRLLEETVIRTVGTFGIPGERLAGATGVWVRQKNAGGKATLAADGELAKICAMGVKLRRWITLHGLALNVTTDLTYFSMINACGLGRPVTSMQRLLGEKCPGMEEVKGKLAGVMGEVLGAGVYDF